MRRWAVFPVLVYCFESHPATNEMLLSWLDVTVEKAWMTCWKLWKLRCTRVVHSGELDIGSIHSKKSIWQYTSVASWYTPWQTKRRQLKQLNANIQSGHSRKPSTECYPMHVVKSRVMCIWKWLKHIKTAWASDRLIFCDLPNLPFIFGIVSCSSVEVSQMSWFHVRTTGCSLTPEVRELNDSTRVLGMCLGVTSHWTKALWSVHVSCVHCVHFTLGSSELYHQGFLALLRLLF